MTADELKRRTRPLGLRIIRVAEALPPTPTGQVIGRQLLRAGTGVGANYRAACRSRSDKDFLARLGIVEEEADETLYWLDLVVQAGLVREARGRDLREEAEAILRIIVASIRTAKKRRDTGARRPGIQNPKSATRNRRRQEP